MEVNVKLYRVKPLKFVPTAGYGFDAEDRWVAETPYGELTLFRDVADLDGDDRRVWFFEDTNGCVCTDQYDTRESAESAAVQWFVGRVTECMEEVR